jgi:hypothetical protein
MPLNPLTRKTDRHQLTEEELRDFRERQVAGSSLAEAKRGKLPARGSPDGGKSEAPSPLATLAGLGALTLDSGRSSAADTPANSPCALSQPPLLPERPSPVEPAPPSAPKTHGASKPKPSAGKSASKPPLAALTQHSTGVTVEAPGTSNLLTPVQWQVARSRSDASPASDDGSNTARIAALEKRQDKVEKQMCSFYDRLKQLGG